MYLRQHRPTRIAKFIISLYIIVAIICVFLLGHFSNNIAQATYQSQHQLSQPKITRQIESHWHRPLTTTKHMWVVIHTARHFTPIQQEHADNIMNYLESNHTHFGIKHVTAPIDNKNEEHNLMSKDHTTELIQLDVNKHQSLPNIAHNLRQHMNTSKLHVYFTSSDSIHNALANQNFNLQPGIMVTFAILTFILFWWAFSSPITAIFSIFCSIICVEIAKALMLLPAIFTPSANLLQTNTSNLNIFLIVLLIVSFLYNFVFDNKMQKEIRYQKDDLININLAKQNTNLRMLPYISALALFSLILPYGISLTIGLVALYVLQPLLEATITQYYPQFILPTSSRNYAPKRITAYLILLLSVIILGFGAFHHPATNLHLTSNLHNASQLQAGEKLIHEHYPTRVTQPTYLYLSSHHKLTSKADLQTIDALTLKLRHHNNIESVHSFTQPTGSQLSSLYLSNQLHLLADQKLNQKLLAPIQGDSQSMKKLNNQLNLMDSNYQEFGKKRLQAVHTTSASTALAQIHHQHHLINKIQSKLKHNPNNSQISSELNTLQTETDHINKNVKIASQHSDADRLYVPASILKSSLFAQNRSDYFSKNNHSTVLKIGTTRHVTQHQLNNIAHSAHHDLNGTPLQSAKIGIDSTRYQTMYAQSHIFSALWIPILFSGIVACFILVVIKHRISILGHFILGVLCSIASLGLLSLFWHSLMLGNNVSILFLTLVYALLFGSDDTYNKVKHPLFCLYLAGAISLCLTNQLGLLQIGVGLIISCILMLVILSNWLVLIPKHQ